MSAYREKHLQTHLPHQNRESHINLGLIGHSFNPQIQEPSQLQADHLETIEESTVARGNSAQPRSLAQKEENTNEGGRDKVVHKPAPPRSEHRSSRIQHDSPWKTYEKGYDLKFDRFVTVAARKAPYQGKVAIKVFAKQDASHKLDMIRRVSHERFVNLLEVFEFNETCYAVFEHIFTSLKQVVGSAAYPSERQLAATLGQILEGLGYLSSTGLQHGSLTCSNVLLKPDGEIKIANQECCQLVDKSYPSDVRAVGYITMELMQKYAKEDEAIGIDNLNRWPADSEAVKFLSMTTSAASIEELKKHALLKRPWRRQDLELLEELASFSVRRAYKYHT